MEGQGALGPPQGRVAGEVMNGRSITFWRVPLEYPPRSPVQVAERLRTMADANTHSMQVSGLNCCPRYLLRQPSRPDRELTLWAQFVPGPIARNVGTAPSGPFGRLLPGQPSNEPSAARPKRAGQGRPTARLANRRLIAGVWTVAVGGPPGAGATMVFKCVGPGRLVLRPGPLPP